MVSRALGLSHASAKIWYALIIKFRRGAGGTDGIGPPCLAQCEVPKATAAATGWGVGQVNGDWYAHSPDYPGFNADIFMNTPEMPRILDWVVPVRYDGRIGVLQFYAGEPGTSYLVTLITNEVINLETGAVLGEANAFEDCEATVLH